MLCLPGLTPVANDAHEVGDSGETVVAEFVQSAAAAHHGDIAGMLDRRP